MASRLNPYISFGDTARSAMEVLPPGVRWRPAPEHLRGDGHPGRLPRRRQDHARAARDRARLHPHGRRHPVRHGPPPGRHGRDQPQAANDADDLRRYWEKLSDGGQVTVPLEKQMWGDEFGACIDRFGVSWMVDIGEPRPDPAVDAGAPEISAAATSPTKILRPRQGHTPFRGH